MDENIKARAQDAAGEVAENPTTTATQRGRYKFALIEIARTVAQLAAQRDAMPLQQLQTESCPLDPSTPLVLAARGACLERGYHADGSAPRFGGVDRREDPLAVLQQQPGIKFAGYYNSDEVSGKTILDFMRALLEADPAEVQPGAVLEIEAAWVQPQQWRVVRAGNPVEVERITPAAKGCGGTGQWIGGMPCLGCDECPALQGDAKAPTVAARILSPASDPMREFFTCTVKRNEGGTFYMTKLGAAREPYALYRNEVEALFISMGAALGIDVLAIAPRPDWFTCHVIADLAGVDEALRGFSEDPTGDNGTCVVREVLQAAGLAPVGEWLDIGEHRPSNGQPVWAAILTNYKNAPPVYSVSPAVFEYGQFRDAQSENTLQTPTHWMVRDRPAPPPLPAKVAL